MLPCDKRQTIVNRSDGSERHRCMNRQCEAFGSGVDAQACMLCTHRVERIDRKCKRPNTEPAPEMVKEAAEIMQMIKESPLGESDIAEVQTPSGVPDYPALSLQLWLYKEALTRWIGEGRPIRSDEDVEAIHTKFCKPCEWYDAEKKRCRGCGCKVSTSTFAVINKIKMATEHCPKGLW